MKERGILFSAPMVRALLAGAKTQTRRALKNQAVLIDGGGVPFTQRWDDDEQVNWRTDVRCPYGAPGDRLWVRETFALIWPGEGPPAAVRDHHVEYRADCPNKFPGQWPDDLADDAERPRWRPSIFLPRWASRITLEVTEVRVQRLQDISEEDAKAEGVEPDSDCLTNRCRRPHFDRYMDLWDEINGKGSWQANPLVWAISFRRLP